MELERKTFEVEVRHTSDDDGTATFLASVFGNVDADGDIMDRGAFHDTLKARTPKFVADHRWEVTSKLGRVLAARETDEGLEVSVKFGLHSPLARQVYEDWKFDPHQEFSIGFRIPDGGVEWDKKGIRHIKSVELFEVSNVLIGSNSETRLVDVKAEDADDHFELSADEEKAVDRSSWDGSAAMAAAGRSSNPARAFAAICAGRREGDPSERQTWALPHHKRPGAAPNANGVRAARGRFNQTEGLVNRAAAARHLERHASAIAEADGMSLDEWLMLKDVDEPDEDGQRRTDRTEDAERLDRLADALAEVLTEER